MGKSLFPAASQRYPDVTCAYRDVEIQTVAIINAVEERSFNPHGGHLFCGIVLGMKHALMPARLRLELELELGGRQ